MKYFILRNIVLITLLIGFKIAFSQCTPGNEESCPDPEGNGQMCPEELKSAYVGLDYHQEVTILAPVQLDTLDLQIPVHHLTLIDVENLPEGINWESNAADNEFMAGMYYCMLLSGITNVDAGSYPLKIIIDVYADVQGVGVKVATLTDSTTLSLNVEWDPNSIGERKQNLLMASMWPNPVADYLNIELQTNVSGSIEVELVNLLGHRVFDKSYEILSNDPFLKIDLRSIPAGTYLFTVINNSLRNSKLITISKP